MSAVSVAFVSTAALVATWLVPAWHGMNEDARMALALVALVALSAVVSMGLCHLVWRWLRPRVSKRLQSLIFPEDGEIPPSAD